MNFVCNAVFIHMIYIYTENKYIPKTIAANTSVPYLEKKSYNLYLLILSGDCPSTLLALY